MSKTLGFVDILSEFLKWNNLCCKFTKYKQDNI